MAGTRSRYIYEMRDKMRYFRSNKGTGFHYSSRPKEDNNVMMTYINSRWNTSDNIGRGVMIDNIFMGVCITKLLIYKKDYNNNYWPQWDFYRYYLNLCSQNGGENTVGQRLATNQLKTMIPGQTTDFWKTKKSIGQRYHYLIDRWGHGAALLFPTDCPALPISVYERKIYP